MDDHSFLFKLEIGTIVFLTAAVFIIGIPMSIARAIRRKKHHKQTSAHEPNA